VFLFIFYTDIEFITVIKTLLYLRDKVTEFYIEMDDFYIEFAKMIENRPKIKNSSVKRRNRPGKLSDSEMMSVYLLFHFGQFTNYKHFYLHMFVNI